MVFTPLLTSTTVGTLDARSVAGKWTVQNSSSHRQPASMLVPGIRMLGLVLVYRHDTTGLQGATCPMTYYRTLTSPCLAVH